MKLRESAKKFISSYHCNTIFYIISTNILARKLPIISFFFKGSISLKSKVRTMTDSVCLPHSWLQKHFFVINILILHQMSADFSSFYDYLLFQKLSTLKIQFKLQYYYFWIVVHVLEKLTSFDITSVITPVAQTRRCMRFPSWLCLTFLFLWLLLIENCCSLRRAEKIGLRDWNIFMKHIFKEASTNL